MHILKCLLVCGPLLFLKWSGSLPSIYNKIGTITSSEKWEGDTSHFIFEGNGDFHLNAEEAGHSYIFKKCTFSKDMRWSLKLKIDFAPSSNNRLKIILASRDSLYTAEAITLEVGEAGGMDAIELYHYNDGIKNLMARGSNGLVAKAFELNIDLIKNDREIWILSAHLPGQVPCTPEFSIPLQESSLQEMQYTGIELMYTSSNTDAFHFENLVYETYYHDMEAPKLSKLEVVERDSLILQFDEIIQSETGVIWLNDELGNTLLPDKVCQDSLYCHRIHLSLETALDPIKLYNLNILDLLDADGNPADIKFDSIRYNPSPGPRELIINEILFDPYPGLEDFVELYNPTNKFLQLKDLVLCNASRTDCTRITSDLILNPSGIIAFSPDPNTLKAQYSPPIEAQVIGQDLPRFNNDSGNISLRVESDGHQLTLDSFDYHVDMHFSLIKNSEGVSLERLSPHADSNSPQNWYSGVESSNWATPGYKNANGQAEDHKLSSFSFQNEVFSPDGDGYQDLLIFNYNLDTNHYIANAWILNSWGGFHKQVANTELTSQNGIISWNGLDRFERPSPMGIYVLYYEFVHANGNRLNGKRAFVLAYRI